MPSKLGLGTVQFGLPYGITNRSGQVPRSEGELVLEVARKAGIDTLDTAIAYGESEQRLGEMGVADFRVVSKLGAAPEAESLAAWAMREVSGSLERLRIDRLAGLLLHRSQSLEGDRGAELFDALQSLKAQRLVEKIGVSIYDPEELDHLGGRYSFDLVQAPYSILDRRIESSGWLTRLGASGTEIHTRSVFLQGLLLLRPEQLPGPFTRWRPLWEKWQSWLERSGCSALSASLGFAIAQPAVSRVIIGVENAQQLSDAVTASNSIIEEFPDEISSTDMDLISPVRWRTT